MDRIGGSKRFFRTARTRTHACFSFRINHKRRCSQQQYSVAGYLSELYCTGLVPLRSIHQEQHLRLHSPSDLELDAPPTTLSRLSFFTCGLVTHSWVATRKGRQNHHQEETCIVDRGPKPLDFGTDNVGGQAIFLDGCCIKSLLCSFP